MFPFLSYSGLLPVVGMKMEIMKWRILKPCGQIFMLLAALLPICLGLDYDTYIVHMDKSQMPSLFVDHLNWYDSSLKSASQNGEMMYAFNEVMHGFTTRMTAEEAQNLQNQPGVLSVRRETMYHLHTTRTPSFLGIDQNPHFSPAANSYNVNSSNVVIGVLDTGVWPESKSFYDAGFGPVPSSWNGTCETGTNFTTSNCNKKLIGARSFYQSYEYALKKKRMTMKESKSARDDDGHGTHTASTAAGSPVSDASLFGYATGTARGMAPRARVAVYKVCWLQGCTDSDILAGMEQAILDQVNVLSLSLGGAVVEYTSDVIAMGALAATERGIFVSCSAGNSGPAPSMISNLAPWITTVGASTLDRIFPANVTLDNGESYSGVSLYHGTPLPQGKMFPLFYGGNASGVPTNESRCLSGYLDPKKVQGKIVVCDRGGGARVQKALVVQQAGGVGTVLANTAAEGEELVADAQLAPAAAVGQKDGDKIKGYYLSSNRLGKATILLGGAQEVGIKPAPVVAAFSSRGPNPLSPQILKPDLIAPGVNILAGWTGAAGPSGLENDTRKVEFNIISGTSMSCPHVSGLAAVVKAVHPDWSPAAIRSALMTTAYNSDNSGSRILDVATGKPATPFDLGAGHVHPVLAMDPGLVYDISLADYANFMCASGYSVSAVTTSKAPFRCDKKFRVADLNYPSFAVLFNTTKSSSVKYPRTLTNVGDLAGTYKVSVKLDDGSSNLLNVSVEPQTLAFSKKWEKKSYTVTFSASAKWPASGTNVFGRIEWTDGKHVVGTPLAVSGYS